MADPMSLLMALGAGAQSAGSLAGGFLGGQGGLNPSEMIMTTFNSANDLGLQSSQFDALNQIGFGDIANVPNPLQQLLNRVEALPIDNKAKRRAINGIVRTFSGDADRVRQKETNAVLRRLGITPAELPALMERNAAFQTRQRELQERMAPLQDQTILNRAQAAQSASQLLGDAGRFASGGPASDFQTRIMDSLNRGINDQEEALMLRAQFGGFNPAAGLEGIQRMRQDSEITALQQAIQAATALTAGLNAGNAQAQQSAGLNSNAALNALGIASQQAMAANQLAQQASINRADSMANGISGAMGSLGQAAMLPGLFGMMNQQPQQSPMSSSFGTFGGPGSTANQYSTMAARTPGFNPIVNF